MLPTDWSAPSGAVLARVSDPRVRQYWDPDHVLATRMAQDARPPQPEQDCCVRSGILWDLAALYPPGAAWSERMPPAVLFNGPVVDVVNEIDAALVSSGKRDAASSGGWLGPPAGRVAGAAAPEAAPAPGF
jgi:hypothetical protein